MSDVTQILSRIESGDPTASEQLLPLVYDELTATASGPPSLNPTLNPALHLAIEARHDSEALNEFTLAGKLRSIVFEANGTIESQLPDPPKDANKMRLKTWLALGSRRNGAQEQEPVVVPANEWRALHEKVYKLASAKQAPNENGEFGH